MGRLFAGAALAALVGVSPPEQAAGQSASPIRSIAVFVPGVVQGSPIYELMDKGVRRAASEVPGTTVKTIEGGFNQAQWGQQVMALAAGGQYDLIVSSNPAMPEICAPVVQAFPNQRFVIVEAWAQGLPSVASIYFNHREMGWLHGYLAGLLADAKGAPPKIGLIVGQEYPEMDKAILPGVEEGLKAENPAGSVEFRVVGNWYDASKAEELAKSLLASGTAVFLPIAGSAGQGVITAAKQAHAAVLWYDSNANKVEKGVVLGSGRIAYDRAAYEMVKGALNGTLRYNQPKVVGVKEGYVDYFTDAPEWKRYVPSGVRRAFEKVLDQFRSGNRFLPMPLPSPP